MSIASEITRINGNISSAYSAAQARGATLPQAQNSANLADTILSIPVYPIYGVSGLASDNSTTSLTRTDDAVGKSYAINSATGAVASDFDNLFPWNEAEIVIDTAGKFLKLPEMYFRVGTNGNYEIKDIAVSKAPTGIGAWYKVDPFCIGCYGGSVSNNKLQSVSGESRSNNITRANFRTFAKENGDRKGCRIRFAGRLYRETDRRHRRLDNSQRLRNFLRSNAVSLY